MRRVLLLLIGITALTASERAVAAPASLTFAYGHHLLTVSVAAHPEWRRPKEVWLYHGIEAVPESRLLSCGEDEILEEGWTKKSVPGWDEDAVARTVRDEVASKLDRDAGSVTIGKTLSGSIVFEGEGLPGRRVDVREAAMLAVQALEGDVSWVMLPVSETPASVTVTDGGLAGMGIREVVTVGESVFAGSPVNRRHNIGVGVAKFNGHLIPQGSIFSFVETLGPVNQYTGYRKELVIQGETTIPDYGGGLCQVSSTAYRGPWEYGLPIVQRKNHSYAVSYYSPQGTDATIYPPSVDMKFRNDTPGALLIQSFVDESDRAYFIYYGTKDDRRTEVFGPFISNRVAAPREEKVVYTTEIPPGEKRKAGERHDGLRAVWYRNIRSGTGSNVERFASFYEARPLTWQIGIGSARETPGDASETPSWLPRRDATN